MSSGEEDEAKAPERDDELDELMNSALEDMSYMQSKKRGNHVGGSSIKPSADGVDWNPSEHIWSEEFLDNAAATFQSNMTSLLGALKGSSDESLTQEQVTATFQMMAEAAAQVMKPNDEIPDKGKIKSPNDVSATIAQTLESLNSNSDDLKKAMSDDELAKMFSGLGVNSQDGTPNMFLPFMQNVMQSLLSKEVLYPSLKGMIERYPEWLEKNKSKLEKKEYDRYWRQNNLMVKVCNELEKEKETDSEEIKKKRFEVLLELMQQMQELGQPPAELSNESGFGEQPNFANIEGFNTDPNQCRPM